MSLHLVTGYAGREHVTSADHGSFNIAFVGAGEYVFDRGQKFAASIIDNNTVDVADGDIMMQGRHIRQIENHVTRLTFVNGERGFYRNDLIVAEYRKDPETFVESATLKVIKGTQTDNAENVTDPEHTHADITEATGAILNQMPLYRVKFTGFEITAVERLFEYLPSVQHVLDSMWDDIREIPTQAEEYFESEKARFTSEINAAEAQFLQDLNNTEVSNQQAFQTWFDTIKGILDEDAAGHLQNEIDGLNSSKAQLENAIDTSWHASDHFYKGRDLTVVFASEIANYSDEWAWIQARLNNHNLRGIHVADYIPIKIAEGGGTPAQVHWAEIAGINTYHRTGIGVNAVGYHIDWITRQCYPRQVKWNTESTNNGNSSNAQPFLASNLKNWLDTVVYPRLETKLKNVIKPKIVLAPTRYQSGTTLTDDNSWAWSSFDKLWVPFESEVFDTPLWSTKGFGYGQAVQYPIFANSYEHRMKGPGWWLASAFSGGAAYAVFVGGDGSSNFTGTSDKLFVPLCFRTMED